MLKNHKKLTPPSDDKRWRIVEAAMRRHGYHPNALIEVLHTVQESFGFLDEDALRYIAASLSVPLSRVYGVATFYHFFTLKPQGEHSCVVCMGTACYIKGSASIIQEIEKEFGVKPGQTTPDNKFSMMSARCLGSCGLAPAAVFDGDMTGKLEPEQVVERVREWLK